jgi:hypothetical protein
MCTRILARSMQHREHLLVVSLLYPRFLSCVLLSIHSRHCLAAMRCASLLRQQVVSLFDVLLAGHWKPPATAAGAAEQFQQWGVRTRNRPLPPPYGAAIAHKCMHEGDFHTAMRVVLSQEDPTPLLRCLCESLALEEAGTVRVDVCEAALQFWAPAVRALEANTTLHASCFVVLLHYAGHMLQEPTAPALLRDDAQRVVDAAIRMAQQSPCHAVMFIGPIARAATEGVIDRLIPLMEGIFRGNRYVDVSDLRHVLRLVTKRRDADHHVMMWWRWMQHTHLSLDTSVMSLMVEVMSRNKKTSDAAELVHQLHSLGATPSHQGQIAYLEHLATIVRPPTPQAELLVDLWSQDLEDHLHANKLQWLLLQFYFASGNNAMILKTCQRILEVHSEALDTDKLVNILNYVVEHPSPSRGTEAEKLAVDTALARCTPSTAPLICVVAVLADRSKCIETVGPWLEHCNDDLFEEALALVASRNSKLVLELCEVAHRVVPDALQAWASLLEDESVPQA